MHHVAFSLPTWKALPAGDPNWPQTDWQGNPSHAGSGDQIIYNNIIYKANRYTSSIPESNGSWSKVCNI